MIASNRTNDKVVSPVVQHDGFPEDEEDACKEKRKIQLYTPQGNQTSFSSLYYYVNFVYFTKFLTVYLSMFALVLKLISCVLISLTLLFDKNFNYASTIINAF